MFFPLQFDIHSVEMWHYVRQKSNNSQFMIIF